MNEIVVGSKIAKGRKEKNLSQSQFAEMLNVSPQAVSKWERGESLPDVLMLGRIAALAGVDMNHFFGMQSVEAEIRVRPRNMSFSEWKDADFSGLSNLHEKMSAANVERCKFINANLSGIDFKATNLKQNDFTNANLSDCKFSMTNIERSILVGTNLSNSLFKGSRIMDVDFSGAILNGAEFNKNEFKRVILSGEIFDCSFVYNTYKQVEFRNVTFKNVFFKGKFKGAIFVNCKADRVTYAFLQNSKINLDGVTLIN